MRSMNFRFFVIAAAIIGLTGCATAPSLQSARPASANDRRISLAKSETAAKTDHVTKHLNADGSVIYSQNFGGGGVSLGLLLGPLGVAANMKMIDGVTSADAVRLKGKLGLDPVRAFQEAASITHFAIGTPANQGDVTVTPYVLVSKTNESTVHISSVVLFEGVDDQKKWVKRYQYQLPGKYTLDELAALDATQVSSVQTARANAYALLLKHVAEESDATVSQERRIIFKSAYLSPRFEFEMAGVAAVDAQDIQYRITKN